MDREQIILDRLVQDADVRRELLRKIVQPQPYLVWTDFDHNRQDLLQTNIHHLPKWNEIGEFLKLHLLFQMAVEEGGWAFTVRVRPDLEAK